MNARRSRSIVLLSAFLLLSCSAVSSAFAIKRRAAGAPVAPAGPTQWQHDWVKGAVFYEVFVRSFSDSNGDGIGDINGLIAKLDYLNDGNPATTQDLGVTALWLMPMFDSPSYHGYDTVDYEKIEPDYGTNDDFQRLLDEAHRRGIRIIIDFVVNHTSSQHPWFLDSASSPSSPKRDWYVWSPTRLAWGPPWGGGGDTWHERSGAYYYGVFWSGMPDVNWRNANAKNELLRIAKAWLAKGVDGYRLDATRYLVETGGGSGQSDTQETHQALKDLATAVREAKPEAILVAENWTETPIIATYYGSTSVIAGGDEMPMNFDFPLAAAILQGVNDGNASTIGLKLREVQRTYPAGVLDAPFLTNHDQRRLASELGNNAGKLRSAAAVLLTLPGAPFLYYGEEVGILNGPTGGDESKRTPMPWTANGGFTTGNPWFNYAPGAQTANVASQTNDAGSLLSRYRNLIRARNNSSALRTGELEMLDSGTGQVLAFARRANDETVLVLHNVGESFITTRTLAVDASRFETILADSGVTMNGANGSWTVSLPPRTSAIYRVR